MSKATVTARQGGGEQVTAKVFSNISGFELDCKRRVLTIIDSSGQRFAFDVASDLFGNPDIFDWTLTEATSGNYTLVAAPD